MSDTERKSRLIPVSRWAEHHVWPTVAALRHLVYNCKEKNFANCIVRVNGRVLIDEDEFLEWAHRQNEDKQP